MSKMLEREQRLDSLRRERTQKPAPMPAAEAAPALEPLLSNATPPPPAPTRLAMAPAPSMTEGPAPTRRLQGRWRLLLAFACSLLLLGALAWWGRRLPTAPLLAADDQPRPMELVAEEPAGGWTITFEEDAVTYPEGPLAIPQLPEVSLAEWPTPEPRLTPLVVVAAAPVEAVNPEVREAARILQLMETALTDVTRRALFAEGHEPPDASER